MKFIIIDDFENPMSKVVLPPSDNAAHDPDNPSIIFVNFFQYFSLMQNYIEMISYQEMEYSLEKYLESIP